MISHSRSMKYKWRWASLAALSTLLSILSRAEFAAQSKSRLGAAVVALFGKLTDIRPAVRDQANAVLNAVRATFQPLDVVAAVWAVYLASVAVSSLSHPPLSPSPAGAGLRGCWRSRTRPKLRCCSSSEPWRPTAARFVAVRCGSCLRILIGAGSCFSTSTSRRSPARSWLEWRLCSRTPRTDSPAAGRPRPSPWPARGCWYAPLLCSMAWHGTVWLDEPLSIVYCLLPFTGAGVQCAGRRRPCAGWRPSCWPSAALWPRRSPWRGELHRMKSCLGPRSDGDRSCLLHRIFPSLRALLGLGIADADSHVRKTFRQIFWVTGQRSAAMAAELQAYFLHDDAKKEGGGGGAASIAPAVQKVLRAKVEGPASEELAALLQMACNPQEVADTLDQHLLWGSGAGADAPLPVESSRACCNTIRWPPLAALEHVLLSQPQPWLRTHCNTSKWPPLLAAPEHVLLSHGQPWILLRNCNTTMWLVNEAAKHTFPSHEHGTLVEGNVLVKLTSISFFSWRDWIPRPLLSVCLRQYCRLNTLIYY